MLQTNCSLLWSRPIIGGTTRYEECENSQRSMKIDTTQLGNIDMMTNEEIGRKVRELILARQQFFYIADIEFLKKYFSANNRAFIECLQREFKVDLQALKRAAFSIFTEWQAADDCKHTSYKEAHKHLTAHLRIKLRNGNTRQQTTKQQRDSDFANYLQQSLSTTANREQIPNRLQPK